MAAETLKVIKVGNSRGVRLPNEVLKRYQIGNEVEMIQTSEGVLLRPVQANKLSLEESFREMALDKVILSELSELDSTLSDGLGNEDFDFLR
jgi:antitoxin MazE